MSSILREMVADFHRKNDFAESVPFPDVRAHGDDGARLRLRLTTLAGVMLEYAKMLSTAEYKDEEMKLLATRVHLIVEEAGETIQAIADGDMLKAFDGTLDSAYVNVGFCVTYGLPFDEGFEEVHRSNMTKQRQATDPEGHRCRDKGPDFKPPNLQAIKRIRDARFEGHRTAKYECGCADEIDFHTTIRCRLHGAPLTWTGTAA